MNQKNHLALRKGGSKPGAEAHCPCPPLLSRMVNVIPSRRKAASLGGLALGPDRKETLEDFIQGPSSWLCDVVNCTKKGSQTGK